MFALLDCVRYNEDFVKSRFCSIHFTVILAGLKKIVCYFEDFIIYRGSLYRGSIVWNLRNYQPRPHSLAITFGGIFEFEHGIWLLRRPAGLCLPCPM